MFAQWWLILKRNQSEPMVDLPIGKEDTFTVKRLYFDSKKQAELTL